MPLSLSQDNQVINHQGIVAQLVEVRLLHLVRVPLETMVAFCILCLVIWVAGVIRMTVTAEAARVVVDTKLAGVDLTGSPPYLEDGMI